MKMYTFTKTAFVATLANSVAPLKPEWWALEGLAVLEEELVLANLVNRDYNNQVANAGDTVHVNKPGTFKAKHKVKGSSTTIQDATATDTLVKLDQHLEVTIILDDRDIQNSLADLREYFLAPQMRAMAEGIDGAIVGTLPEFYLNSAGTLGTALTAASLINLGKVFDANLVPASGRNLVVGPTGKADMLGIDRYSDVDKSGRESLFLNGRIGDVMGFSVFMSQTVGKVIAGGATTTTETLDLAELAGATVINIAAATASHTKGTWLSIAGVPGVYRLAAAVTITTSNDFTIEAPGLLAGAANSSVVTFYENAAALTNGATAVGGIAVITDGYTSATEIPVIGTSITFGSVLTEGQYTVTDVDGTWASSATLITLTLNRPLGEALTDGEVINVMPTGGSYNMAMRKDAITLVNRPMSPASAGVQSAVFDTGEFSLRATVGYDMALMQTKITLDTLLGVKVLDTDQGAMLIN